MGIIVIVIWGINMLKIADISTGSDQPQQVDSLSFDEAFFTIPELSKNNYNDNYRNPFQIQLTEKVKKKSTPKPKPPIKKIQLPRLTLTGVIEGTALLKNSRHMVFFATVGDTVEGAVVESVTQDSVVLEYKSKQLIVKL